MLRAMLCSAAALALCVGGAFAQATKDTKDTNKNKGKHEAKGHGKTKHSH